MKKWIESRLIIIVLLILVTYGLLSTDLTSTWGINKTVNWMWDITNLYFLVPMIFWVSLIVIYSLLAIFKVQTSLILSSIQLFLLGVLLFVIQNSFPEFYFELTTAGLLILIFNTIISIRKKYIL